MYSKMEYSIPTLYGPEREIGLKKFHGQITHELYNKIKTKNKKLID